MCVPWDHRLCDKHVDEGATRCCICEQCSHTLCTTYGDLDLEIRTLSANVTESAAWIGVHGTVNIGSVSIADECAAELRSHGGRHAYWNNRLWTVHIHVCSSVFWLFPFVFVSPRHVSSACTDVHTCHAHDCPTTAISSHHSGTACAIQKLRVTSMYRSRLHWLRPDDLVFCFYFISQIWNSR